MLCFLISGWPPEEQRKIAHAIFELCVRAGLSFSISSRREQVPTGTVVLTYSRDDEAAGLAIPCGWGKSVQVVEQAGSRVFAATANCGAPDLVAGTAYLLGLETEKRVGPEGLDRLGRIDPARNALRLNGLLCSPIMEDSANLFRRQIERLGVWIPAHHSLPWPGQAKRAVVLTHDIDGPRLQSLRTLARYLVYGFAMGARDGRESFVYGSLTRLFKRPDPQWAFEHWRRLEEAYGIRSTFFVYPGHQAAGWHRLDPSYDPREPQLAEELRQLASNGWEIGVHTGLGAQSAHHHREGRARVGSIVNLDRVLGARAHYWGRDWLATQTSWRQLEEAGFQYDAGANPGTLGFRFGTALPFMPTFGARGGNCDGLVVLPTAIMDSYAVPRTSGMTKPDLADALAKIEAAAAKNGFLMLDWHERVLANLGVWKGFMAPLLERLNLWVEDSDVCFVTAREAAELWRAHAKRCYSPAMNWEGEHA